MPFTHKNPNRTVIVRGGKPTNCSKLPASISINDEGTCVQVPLLSGDRVFWTVSEDEVLLSDSASRLASITNADLDLERIVMDLLPSLPDSLRGDKSPWRNIHSIPAATILHLDKSNRPRYTRAEPSPAKHVPSNEILASLRSRFLTIADEWRNEAPLSADVSGGVDSAAITYVFASEGVRMPLYHETPDDPMNQDSRWAERISEDVRMPLIKIGRVVDGNRSFEPAAEYPNREIPEEPVYWSDIEGYLSRISEMEADAQAVSMSRVSEETSCSHPCHPHHGAACGNTRYGYGTSEDNTAPITGSHPIRQFSISPMAPICMRNYGHRSWTRNKVMTIVLRLVDGMMPYAFPNS